MIKVGDKFRHFNGIIYEIIALVTHTETLEEMVVYKSDKNIWVRPRSMFLTDEDVSIKPDNVTGQKYRFEKIGGLI